VDIYYESSYFPPDILLSMMNRVIMYILRTGGKPMVMNRLLNGLHRIEQLNESQKKGTFFGTVRGI
jgi:hypothetical protein